MPMSIDFDDAALQTVMSLPMPSLALNGVATVSGVSNEMITLADIGLGILRSCIIARSFQTPILDSFNPQVDFAIGEARLANIAGTSGLLQRLSFDGVATNARAAAIVLRAYIGASFRSSIQSNAPNAIHSSINDICTMILEDEPIGGQ